MLTNETPVANDSGPDMEQAVRERYSAASKARESALCCAVTYDRKYLEVLPPEIAERDYGCGDPTQHVRPGEYVLDLGSGSGKICYIASQIVGPQGRVTGIDMNDDMLELARKFRREVGDRIGWHNVDFRKGRIQDLAFDLEKFDTHLRDHPVHTAADWLEMQRMTDELRQRSPMIAPQSIDVVLSNCVLNLVTLEDRECLFQELFRVLRPGGRVVISDIVSNKEIPAHLQSDPRLWSGCISGAFVEQDFIEAFERAGFYGVEILNRQHEPWTTVNDIEFRSVTLRAFKPKSNSGQDLHHQVIYRGPWKRVFDETGTTLERGRSTSVSNQQFARYTAEPYSHDILAEADRGGLLPMAKSLNASCCEPEKKS